MQGRSISGILIGKSMLWLLMGVLVILIGKSLLWLLMGVLVITHAWKTYLRNIDW